MTTLIRRFAMSLLGLVLVVAGLMVVPGVAGAQSGEPAAQTLRCSAVQGVDENVNADISGSDVSAARDYLPLFRWGSASGGFHSRLGAKATDDVRQKISRDLIESVSLSIGNSFWQMGAGLVEFSTSFEVLSKVGCEADVLSAKLGNAFAESGILAMLLALAVLWLLWKAAKPAGMGGGGFDWGRFAQVLGVIVLFFIMLNGANQTRAGNSISPGFDVPNRVNQATLGTIGSGSPAWFAITTNNAISTMASLPASALSVEAGIGGAARPGTCDAYIKELKNRYVTQLASDGAQSLVLADIRASVPLALSAMWEESGLSTWTAVQFGINNSFGEIVNCRVLEQRAGISPLEQLTIHMSEPHSRGNQAVPTNTEHLEVWDGHDNNARDRNIIGWVACDTGDGSFPALRSIPDWNAGIPEDTGERVTVEECEDWWTDGPSDNGMDWPDSSSHVKENTAGGSGTRDFLLNMHGDAVSSGITLSVIFVLVSFIILVVFGILGVGVIIAKLAAVLMIAVVFIVLLWSVLPSQGSARIVKYAKFFFGITLASFGIQFLLALVTTITGFVNTVGVAAFGQGSILSVLWLGFSPVTAIIVLHMVFKHALSAPSPFKLSSAMAYGGAFAGGAALGAGLDRLGARGRGYAQGMRHRLGQRAFDQVSPGRRAAGMAGGKHGMSAAGSRAEKARQSKWTEEADAAAAGVAARRRDEWKQKADARRAASAERHRTGGVAGKMFDKVGSVESRVRAFNQDRKDRGLGRAVWDRSNTARDFFRSRNWGRIAAGTAAATIWAGPGGLVTAGGLAASKAAGLAGAGGAVWGTVGTPVAAAGASTAAWGIGTGVLARYALRGTGTGNYQGMDPSNVGVDRLEALRDGRQIAALDRLDRTHRKVGDQIAGAVRANREPIVVHAAPQPAALTGSGTRSGPSAPTSRSGAK